MNKNIKIAVIAIVIIAAGAAGYLVMKNKDEGTDTSTKETTSINDKTTDENKTPEFNPLSTENESFKATMEVSEEDAVIFEGDIERDTDGNIKFSGEQDGEFVEMYLKQDGTYIVCQGGACYSLSDGEKPFTQSDFVASDEDIAKYKTTAKFIREDSCPAGTCDVWEYTNDDGEPAQVYISQEDRRVSRVTGISEGSDLVIDYEYTDVSITFPENVQALPGGI